MGWTFAYLRDFGCLWLETGIVVVADVVADVRLVRGESNAVLVVTQYVQVIA